MDLPRKKPPTSGGLKLYKNQNPKLTLRRPPSKGSLLRLRFDLDATAQCKQKYSIVRWSIFVW